MKIIFLGDSTTDMNRHRAEGQPYSLGNGHVLMIAEQLLVKDPTLTILNRGCSGDRITNIEERIEKDVLKEVPDVVTIMFGVNDVWHALGGRVELIPLDKWQEGYQSFIDRILKVNPNCRIILMPPFYLHGVATNDKFEQFKVVDKFIARTKKIAEINNLEYIDTQKALVDASKKYGDEAILYDGVHPNVLGAKVLSDIWVKNYYKKS